MSTVGLGVRLRSPRIAAAYLSVQVTLVLVWWIALATSPRVRGWFELDPDRHDVLSAFVLADLVVLVVGSAAAVVALERGVPWAQRCVAWVAGGYAYATLYLAAWVALGGRGWRGLLPMIAATVITTTLAARSETASP